MIVIASIPITIPAAIVVEGDPWVRGFDIDSGFPSCTLVSLVVDGFRRILPQTRPRHPDFRHLFVGANEYTEVHAQKVIHR
jgi:hypothetical protein